MSNTIRRNNILPYNDPKNNENESSDTENTNPLPTSTIDNKVESSSNNILIKDIETLLKKVQKKDNDKK